MAIFGFTAPRCLPAVVCLFAFAVACSANRDATDDSTRARTAVPDSIVVGDSAGAAGPITSADSTALASLRSRLDASAPLLRTPNAFTPLEGTNLSVRRDAGESVIAALVVAGTMEAADTSHSGDAARYLYLFDDNGMTAAVEKSWTDTSNRCAPTVQVADRWMLHDGRLLGYDRILNRAGGGLIDARKCPVGRGQSAVLYTSWPMLANASMAASP